MAATARSIETKKLLGTIRLAITASPIRLPFSRVATASPAFTGYCRRARRR
ncbi:MAG: hypothetical protein R3D28_23760 [Geminicoccaceae bacterium]